MQYGSARRVPVSCISVMLLLLGLIIPFMDSGGQSIVDVYQRQRLVRIAESALADRGGRFAARPPTFLPGPLDSLRSVGRDDAAPEDLKGASMISVLRSQRVPKLGQAWFNKRFADAEWVFLGNDGLAPLDTMMTREIRARLEALFGKPTRTLGDFDARERVSRGDIFEFEYWFVLNDSIPLVITDVNGPFERGIVSSTVSGFGDRLAEMRDQFLGPLVETEQRAAFVDYYFDDEAVQWYRAGYDGSQFFVDPIEQPGMNRPVLDRGQEPLRE